MNANQNNPKSAVASLPAAAPAGSPPEDIIPNAATQAAAADQGTDAEDVTEQDILSALGQLSDGPKAAQAAPAKSETGNPNDEGAEPSEADQGEGDAGVDDAAKSEEAGAVSGDDAAASSGDVDESQDAGAADPAAPVEDPKKVNPTQQRINELTARAKSAEEALARERERLASYDAAASGRLDAGALEHVDTLDALAQQRASIVALHSKLLRNPQGIELPDPNDSSKVVQYDAAGVSELLGQTFQLMHEAIPLREKFLSAREHFDAAAVTAYPWLKDGRQGAGAQVQAVLQANPGLRRIGPNYRLVAADALIGQTLREAGVAVTPQLIAKLKGEAPKANAGAGKPAAVSAPAIRRQPPAAPAKAGVIPPRVAPRAGQGMAADKRLMKGNGNINDLTASIAARL